MKKIVLIYPSNRSNKNQFYFIFQEIFVFVWPIRGVNQNKNILQGVNQKKYFTGGKPEPINPIIYKENTHFQLFLANFFFSKMTSILNTNNTCNKKIRINLNIKKM